MLRSWLVRISPCCYDSGPQNVYHYVVYWLEMFLCASCTKCFLCAIICGEYNSKLQCPIPVPGGLDTHLSLFPELPERHASWRICCQIACLVHSRCVSRPSFYIRRDILWNPVSFSEALWSRLGLRAHPYTDRVRGLLDSLHTAALNAVMTTPSHVFFSLL